MFENRIIQTTEDGSHTIVILNKNISYHSTHGAIQESKHVFIHAGLKYLFDNNSSSSNKTLNIFEVGFGTGLNALLSLEFAMLHQQQINYTTIETFPLNIKEVKQLNYSSIINESIQPNFILMHECEWNRQVIIHPLFSFKKIQQDLLQFETSQQFDIIFFDAFDPTAQPELWTENIFKKMYETLSAKGILVTYSSKGTVRRAMQSAGFNVEKLKGPKGKREIVRAFKN